MKREDRRAILDWVDDTGADAPVRKKIKGILDDIDAMDVLDTVDVEKALERTRRKIGIRKYGRILWTGLAGAAVSAAACTALFLFSGIFSPEVQVPLYSELKVNPGMTGTFVMPDSTVVVLNGGSTLTYSSAYGDRSREVSLCGEAYFDVAEDSDSPFIVRTPSGSYVTVYGTQFNVDAYDDADCKVTLINGKVGFKYAGRYGKINEVVLSPGERLIYERNGDFIQVKEVPVKSDIAWKDGKIILEGTPLSDILDILSKRYAVRFDVKDPAYLDYRYSGGTFTIFSLEKVLETLQYSSSFEWKYDDQASSDSALVVTIY